MRLATATSKSRARGRRADGGFTLAEVLAALLFLAIVVPVAVEVLQVASLSGEVAARKSEAARVADRVLSESLVTTNWMGNQSGTVSEGVLDFRWTVTSQNWSQMPPGQTTWPLELVTAEVIYSAQGKDYSVSLSTLASQTTSSSGMSSPQ